MASPAGHTTVLTELRACATTSSKGCWGLGPLSVARTDPFFLRFFFPNSREKYRSRLHSKFSNSWARRMVERNVEEFRVLYILMR